ncbi:MAG: clostripain-related cysteine peptidase [Planctomycetota bacterium]
MIAIALLSTLTIGPLSSPSAPERPWTFLVYGAADNNADGPILRFLDDLRRALDDDPGMELVLFLDRHEKFSNDEKLLGANFTGGRIFRIRKDSAERLDPGDEFPALTGSGDPEIDSADPENLGRFLAYGKKHFPAKRYGLLIYSHADGRGMCPDDQSGREMWIPELPAKVGADLEVDFLGLELCNMSGIEIAYQWRPGNGGFSADVLLAIPNAGPPLDWHRAFARIRSPGHATAAPAPHFDPNTMTAAELGRLVIEEGARGRKAHADGNDGEDVRYEAAACCDLALAAEVKQKIDAFAVALARTNAKEVFEDLRGPSLSGKTIDFSRGEVGQLPYFDLYQLCDRAAFCDQLTPETRAAARAAADVVDRFVLDSFGMDGLESDGFEDGKSGVFIVFPDGDENTGAFGAGKPLWSKFRWYTPLEQKGKGDPYGRWAFLADGAKPGNGAVENWFELLDSWFDPDSDAKGGTNGYRW